MKYFLITFFSVISFNAYCLFNQKNHLSKTNREENVANSFQEDNDCESKAKAASVRIEADAPAFLQDESGDAKIGGSGTIVQIPEGKFSLPGGLYLLTAEHVIKEDFKTLGRSVQSRHSPLVKNIKAITDNGKIINLDFDEYYCAPSQLFGGEAAFIPLDSLDGVTPVVIGELPKSNSDGQISGYGFPGGENFNSFQAQKGSSFFGGTLKHKNIGEGSQEGQSGGAIMNSSCQIIGVISASDHAGSSYTSSIKKVLSRGKKCSSNNNPNLHLARGGK